MRIETTLAAGDFPYLENVINRLSSSSNPSLHATCANFGTWI